MLTEPWSLQWRTQGEVYNYMISNNYTLIEASQPVYIFHTTGYGGELGGAVLPTIDGCTGSRTCYFYAYSQRRRQFFSEPDGPQ